MQVIPIDSNITLKVFGHHICVLNVWGRVVTSQDAVDEYGRAIIGYIPSAYRASDMAAVGNLTLAGTEQYVMVFMQDGSIKTNRIVNETASTFICWVI